jgi:nucleotide-binding universal stress UspA family protein
LDGSSLAECVLPHAVALAQAFDAQVTLLRAVERVGPADLNRAVDPLNWHMRKSEAEAYLDEVADRLQQIGLQTDQAVAQGKAADRIIDFVHNQDVDLIVLSSHGRGGLSGWNVGSVVQKVILRSYTPTMIVRAYQPVTEELTGLRYERLLVPLDGSQRAECILPLATNLARFHQCRLLLAHVVSKPEVPRRAPLTQEEAELIDQITERNRQKGERYLKELRSRLSGDIETRLLVSENPALTLHQLVEKESADLVLLAAHGYSGEVQWPYGSVALNFIAYGTTPLLIMQDISEEERERTAAEKAASESKGH